MVAAREKFLGERHFLPLAETIVEACKTHASDARFVMEAGAGIGYYIAHVLEALPLTVGLALDLSKFAARRAARAHVRLDAVVTDVIEKLPLKSESVDLALNIFAPRPVPELVRTLHREGRLVVAFPADQHMQEVRNAIGMLTVDPRKEWRISKSLHPSFRLLDAKRCQWKMKLQHNDVEAMVLMGPSARHIDASTVPARIARLDPRMEVTGAVNIHVYERAKHGNT
ncbi:class I SAM-dependent methyltransferase [Occallatibacter riparius]|uniref:Methyltransferase domain-containing protein n=1 Tax=Occallatibacter riparius TaxID=1002689 RepID=A0A9J7BJR1_9BACT|nr:hypothetical protein [Occallatibacter riparius]UWZ82026.1 hypothetical protein MOP44_15760 [Occallatibacter riparius]